MAGKDAGKAFLALASAGILCGIIWRVIVGSMGSGVAWTGWILNGSQLVHLCLILLLIAWARSRAALLLLGYGFFVLWRLLWIPEMIPGGSTRTIIWYHLDDIRMNTLEAFRTRELVSDILFITSTALLATAPIPLLVAKVRQRRLSRGGRA